jgi:hypothetical protein
MHRSPTTLTTAPATPADLRRTLWRWTLVLLALGLLWRVVRYAMRFPFWGDEAYLNTSFLCRDFRGLLEPLEYFQVAPLLYLWGQRVCYLLGGGGEYALRFQSLVAGIAALLLFVPLAWRLLGPRAAAIAVGVFGGSYFVVRYATESKQYSGELLISVVMLWLAAEWLRRPHDVRFALASCLAVIPALWLSFPAAFVAGGISLTLFVVCLRHPSRPAWLGWLGFNLATGASFITYYIVYLYVHSTQKVGTWLEDWWDGAYPPLAAFTGAAGPADLLRAAGELAWWLVTIHTGKMLAFPQGGDHFQSSLTAVLCVIGAFALWRAGQRGLALLLVSALPVMFVAAALHRYPYGGSERTMLFYVPAICLLWGAGAAKVIDEWLPLTWRDRVGGGLGLVLLLFPALGALRDVVEPYKNVGYALARATTAEAAALPQPGDRVVAFNTEFRFDREYVPPEVVEKFGDARVFKNYRGEGSPFGPVLYESIRYYFELYSGTRLRWRERGELDASTDWVLAYSGRDFGPQRALIDERIAAAGLRIVSEHMFRFVPNRPEHLLLLRCAPAD